MPDALQLVNQMTFEMVPSVDVLPQSLIKGLRLVQGMHCWYRWGERQAGVQHVFKNNADRGFEEIFGQNEAVQRAAHCILIIKSLNDCAKGIIKLIACYENLKSSLTNEYPAYVKCKWPKNSKYSVISPFFKENIRLKYIEISTYVVNLCETFFKFLAAFLTVSILTLNAIDALTWNAYSHHRAIGEAVSNSMKVISQLSKNTPLLLEKVVQKQSLISKVLIKCQADFTVRQITLGLQSLMKVSKENKMDPYIKENMAFCTKAVAFDLFNSIGLRSVFPNWFSAALKATPPHTPSDERFAPIYQVAGATEHHDAFLQEKEEGSLVKTPHTNIITFYQRLHSRGYRYKIIEP